MGQAPQVRGPSLTLRCPTPPPPYTPTTRLDIRLMPHRHCSSRLTTISHPLPPCPTPLPQVEQHLVHPLPKIATPQPRPSATGAPRARRHRRCHQQKAKWRRRMALPIIYTRGKVARWQKVARSRALAQTILDYLPCWQGGRAPRRGRDRRKEQRLQQRKFKRKSTTSTQPSCPTPLTHRAAQLHPRPSRPCPPPHLRPNLQNTPKQAPTVPPPPLRLLHPL